MSKKFAIISSIVGILIIGLIGIGIYNNSMEDKEIEVVAELHDLDNRIMPKPLSYKRLEGSISINDKTAIYVKGNTAKESNELYKIAEYLKSKIQVATGFPLKIIKDSNATKGSIFLTTLQGDKSLGNEGYNLNTSKGIIEIRGYSSEGVSRGIQSLRQMFPSEIEKNILVKDIKWTVPAVEIMDKPEYEYRGLMIDVSRHFFSVEDVKRQIDNAAQYKINKVHLHLSDDQGWRLEIKKYPELTNIGSKSEVGGGKGGYYTQTQFKEIIAYAKDRYVEIIPEFDMPGHTNAALASYDFLNKDGQKAKVYTGTKIGFSTFMVHDEKTYELIEEVIKEVAAISPSKYIHIGGDEADATSKEDYDYFVGRVSKIAQKYGKTAIGWDPIDTSKDIDSSTILQNWKDSNKEAQEKKMKMVISIAKKAYLDMKYNESTKYGATWAGLTSVQDAYEWDPTDYAPKELVLGIEAPLWTENVTDAKAMDYMIYPRLIGHAEIGWTPKSQRSFEDYKQRLKAQGERLEYQNINYYKDHTIWNK